MLQGKKLSMFMPHMFGHPSKFWLLLMCFFILSLAGEAQGPKSVAAPVTPPAKRTPIAKKDRGTFPPVPTFKDIGLSQGGTQSRAGVRRGDPYHV